jgi:hypothetical protein
LGGAVTLLLRHFVSPLLSVPNQASHVVCVWAAGAAGDAAGLGAAGAFFAALLAAAPAGLGSGAGAVAAPGPGGTACRPVGARWSVAVVRLHEQGLLTDASVVRACPTHAPTKLQHLQSILPDSRVVLPLDAVLARSSRGAASPALRACAGRQQRGSFDHKRLQAARTRCCGHGSVIPIIIMHHLPCWM